ncbi:hypothetical protein SRRS_19260 [Sporomusa rhizae]|uniref:hypothetical protein n=1 Tax=Sporomusa rhizae TaxID=357999 RepID=UPI00352A61D6
MKYEIIQEIQLLTETIKDNDKLLAHKLAKSFSKLDVSEQLSLHSELPLQVLDTLVRLRNKIDVVNNVKEHLVWHYYYHLLFDNNVVDDLVLEELITCYQEEKYIVLESIIINLLKKHKLEGYQIENIKTAVESREIAKYVVDFEIRNGKIVDKETIKKLYELRAYETLNYILENNSLELDTLNEFRNPEQTEMDRKTKMKLYQKAQIIIQNLKSRS